MKRALILIFVDKGTHKSNVKSFICTIDSIGAKELARDFVVVGIVVE
jgi:hypothetical protein